ncbi:MAG: hypothetical protein K2M27_11395 [Muribaculaceae bacterium]|nr:hypothetical protein [Muribaculaceae bacterium]
MKTILTKLAPALMATLIGACSGTEKTEALTAEITAAQMEGRNAARSVINRQWKDTTGFDQTLEKAVEKRYTYLKHGRPECAEAFDSTFVHTVRTVRPDLMTLIENSILFH